MRAAKARRLTKNVLNGKIDQAPQRREIDRILDVVAHHASRGESEIKAQCQDLVNTITGLICLGYKVQTSNYSKHVLRISWEAPYSEKAMAEILKDVKKYYDL